MNKKHLYLLGSILAFVLVMIACGCYIDSYEYNQPQPDGSMAPRIKAGEVATFTIHGHGECNGDRNNQDYLVIAMLAPKSWDIKNNAVVSYHCTEISDPEVEIPMAVIPDGNSPKNMSGYTWPDALMERFGIGNNVLNDMEWVAWQSTVGLQMLNGSNPIYDVTIKCNVGMTNLRCSLGFFCNDIEDGMTGDEQYWDVVYSEPFTVYDGNGVTIDYCNYHYYAVEPMSAVQNDIITFSFIGDSYDNELVGGDVYLKAIAHLADGSTVENRQLMNYPELGSQTYTCTIWPAGFFGVDDDTVIESIDYVFVNEDESVTIDLALDLKMSGEEFTPGDPFKIALQCN